MGKFDDSDEMEDFDGEDEQSADENEVDGEAAESVEAARPAASRDEVSEEHTIASRQKVRDEMAREIEEFLARGGKIAQIEPNVTADPPRKPESDYGSRPI